jgi:hypothetical protein
VIFSVLVFKRRSWPVFTGLGFGAGRAWEECDSVSWIGRRIATRDGRKCCQGRTPSMLAPSCANLLSKLSIANTGPTELQARICHLLERSPHIPRPLQLDGSSQTDCNTYDDIRRRCWTTWNCEDWYYGSRGSASAPQTSTCLLESVHIMAVYYKLRICNSHAIFTFCLIPVSTSSDFYTWNVLLSAVERALSVVRCDHSCVS